MWGKMLGAGALAIIAALGATPAGSDALNWVRDWRQGQDQLKIVVQSLDTAMTDSSLGREQLQKLTIDVNDCNVSPVNAVSMMRVIEVDNRKHVLQRDLSGVTAPSNQDAARLLRDFKAAILTSLDADDQYESWLQDWQAQYPAANPQNCSHPPHTTAWSAFVALSNSATVEKTAFAKRYNPAAKKYGVRHDWRTWDF